MVEIKHHDLDVFQFFFCLIGSKENKWEACSAIFEHDANLLQSLLYGTFCCQSNVTIKKSLIKIESISPL